MAFLSPKEGIIEHHHLRDELHRQLLQLLDQWTAVNLHFAPPVIDMATLSDARLVCCLGGTLSLGVLDGDKRRAIVLAPPSILFVASGAHAEFSSQDRSTAIVVSFRSDYTRFTLQQAGDPPLNWLHSSARPPRVLSDQLRVMNDFAGASERQPAEIPAMRALVLLLLGELQRPVQAKPGKARRSCIAVLEYLRENCHLPINRESVAAAFGFNPSYLSRLFAKQVGTTFNRYLTRLRLTRAQALLRDPSLEVGRVATLCGFLDSVYFIRVFREHVGTTPGRFRRSLA